MTTNGEWLEYLANNAPDELAAWFDAERTESPISDTMRHIGQVIENTVKRGVYGDTESDNEDSRDKLEAEVRSYFPRREECAETVIGWLDRQRAIDDSICDECSSNYYEMQEEHDQMIDGIAKLMRLKQPYTFDPGEPLENIEIIGRYIDELTAERDELQERLNRTTSAMNRAAGKWAKTDAELRNALDIMRIWISDDAHLGESAISYEFEKAEGLRKLESIKQAITVTIGGLEAERDNLKANNEQLHTLAGEQAAKIDELQSALDDICANLSIIATGEPSVIADIAIETIDALIDECNTANRQCNEYRKKFGKCLDYADAIHALMDEGMA